MCSGIKWWNWIIRRSCTVMWLSCDLPAGSSVTGSTVARCDWLSWSPPPLCHIEVGQLFQTSAIHRKNSLLTVTREVFKNHNKNSKHSQIKKLNFTELLGYKKKAKKYVTTHFFFLTLIHTTLMKFDFQHYKSLTCMTSRALSSTHRPFSGL